MKLVIYGTGGLGKEVYDIALRVNDEQERWKEILFIDDFKPDGQKSYLSKSFQFESLNRFIADFRNIEIVIAVGEPSKRALLAEKIKKVNLNLTTIIDPSAIISPTARIGKGSIVASHSIIASNAILDENILINVNSIIGHDIRVKRDTVISSKVNIGGSSVIGERSFLGMGCSIKEKLTIGNDTIIGMGSIVHSDIPDEVIALGNPARPMRSNSEKRIFK